MTMDKQRIYDAMLLRAFRKDVTVGVLNYWLKPYGIHVPDPELKRQPPRWNIRVQSFVGMYLKALADRLWDTEPPSDIKTLDWMTRWDCEFTDRRRKKELSKARWGDRKAKAVDYAIRTTKYMQCAGNQWGITKAPIRLRRVKLK